MKCNVSRFTYLFICGITFLFLSSCGSDKSDDPEPTPTPSLSVSPQNVTTFNSEGGTSKLDLSANNAWEAVIENSASGWISVSPSHGNSGNHTVNISVTKNSTNENRTGNIVFKSGNLSKSIAVSQSQNNVLEINQKTYNVPAEANKLEISVTSNVDIEATTSEGWVHITSSRALQTKSILVSIDENKTGKQRSASISIKGKDLTETVTITQSAGLVISAENIPEFPSEGATQSITLSSDSKWEAVIGDDIRNWISVSPQSGEAGSFSINITATKNDSKEKREGNIVFKSGSISKSIAVSQSQNNVIEINQKTYNVPAEANKLEISVNSNVDIEATTSEGWVHITSSRALQTKSILVSIDENKTGKQRSASISIKGKDLTETVTIIQEANTSSSADIEDMPIEIL